LAFVSVARGCPAAAACSRARRPPRSRPAHHHGDPVEGNLRIESGTIRSYMLVAPGDAYNADRVDLSLKTLYATGLFSDVAIRRDGTALV